MSARLTHARHLSLIILSFVVMVPVRSAPPYASLGDQLDTSTNAPVTGALTNRYALTPFDQSDGFAPSRLKAVLSALVPDRASSRGVAEARLYAEVSPGVVLIATDDGLGSGSVVSSNGLILTNLHVVGDNRTVAVVFKPRIEGATVTRADIHRGTVVRRDQVADLALVQVLDPPANVKTIPLATMADIAIGSDVHAIGHPTGEAWSYTKGIVSQVRRNYEWTTEDNVLHTANVIQTQTPINPGNSGGPLLTDRGALVGVNSFKTPGEGLNFAVSVDDVRVILNAKSDRLAKAAIAPAPEATCSPKSYGVTRLQDDSGTRELFDIDCFGKPDAALVIPDSPSEPIQLEVDGQHTGKISGILFSKNRDGKWDYSIWDTNGSGKPDLQCFHADGGFKPTRCEKFKG